MKLYISTESLEDTSKHLRETIVNWIKEKGALSTPQVEELAESLGVKPNIINEEICICLATIFHGGRSFEKKMTLDDFDKDEVEKGLEIETEHIDKTSPYAIYFTRKITSDHLAEFKKYNTRLLSLEEQMKADEENV